MPCRLCPGKHKHRQLPCPTDRTHYTVCRCTDVNLIYRPPSLVVILRQLCRHRAAFLCCKTVQDVKHPSFTHCTHHCTQTAAIASTLPRLTEIMISNTLPHTLTDSREWNTFIYDKIHGQTPHLTAPLYQCIHSSWRRRVALRFADDR